MSHFTLFILFVVLSVACGSYGLVNLILTYADRWTTWRFISITGLLLFVVLAYAACTQYVKI
jgi:hypothetical protein